MVWFAAVLRDAIGLSAMITAVGGSPLALVDNYRSALTVMAGFQTEAPGSGGS